MEPIPQDTAETISCHTMVEFWDDASNFIPEEPSCASPDSYRIAPLVANGRSIPAPIEAVAAKMAWLPIIRRCTEPVPEKMGHLRPIDAATPQRGRIHIEYERRHGYGTVSGYELDISDKLCLLIIGRDEPERNGAAKNGVIESLTPILWTEIANIRFEVERPATVTPQTAQAS